MPPPVEAMKTFEALSGAVTSPLAVVRDPNILTANPLQTERVQRRIALPGNGYSHHNPRPGTADMPLNESGEMIIAKRPTTAGILE